MKAKWIISSLGLTSFLLLAICFVCCGAIFFLDSSVEESNTASTARAIAQGETQTIIALTPTDTPTLTPSLTITASPSQTLIPSLTPTITATPLPSLTFTPSLTATITFTPLPSKTPTPRPTQTPTRFEVDLGAIEAVTCIRLVYADETDGRWIVALEIDVLPGLNTQATARRLQQAAFEYTASAFLDFSVIIFDGNQAIDWVWDNDEDVWRQTPLSTKPPACN